MNDTTVKNHGIPEPVTSSAVSSAQSFFALPLDSKMKVFYKNTPNFKGYNPVLSSVNDPASAGDMHEGFEFGWEEIVARQNDEKRANDGAMAGANIWPSEPEGFREAALTY